MSTSMDQNDSDIQYLSEVNRLEESYLRKKGVTILAEDTPISSSQKKRKESEAFGEITSYQVKTEAVSQAKTETETDDDVIVDLVKPVVLNQASSSRSLFKTNSFSGSSVLNRSQSKLNESVQIIPLNHPSGFRYQCDGLGGRKKIFKADNEGGNAASSSRTLANRVFKFKPN